MTPPKRPIKATTPAKKTVAQPPPDLTELREAVVSLAGRVNDLSVALTTVNEIQRQVLLNEKRSKEQEKKTTQIEENLIPRSEHEKRWKKEQQELIETRLSIRKQTYIVGTVFFLVSMLALGIVTTLLIKDIHDRNVARCQASNDYRAQDRQLWEEVESFPASSKQTAQEKAQQAANTKKFNEFLAKHDALQKC